MLLLIKNTNIKIKMPNYYSILEQKEELGKANCQSYFLKI